MLVLTSCLKPLWHISHMLLDAHQASDAAAASTPQQPETYEIDQWILDFAQLFRESLNIEPDRHLDLTNMGWDKLQARIMPVANWSTQLGINA